MGGWVFLALAALEARHDKASRLRWLLTGFSGAAIGMAVMEGYDLGAILSLYLAAFVVFLSWLDVTSMPSDQSTSSSLMVGVTKGAVSQLVVIVVCAGLVAAHALTTLVSTQIKGVAKAEEAMGGVELKTPEQRAAEKEANWNFATQWSLPKIETLRVVVPGLYGYRMDPGTNTYWGRVGQTPGQPTSRYSGSGEYLGVFVFLVALWTFLRSLAGEGCPFDYRSRRIIWFWSAAAFVSLLLAWGRFAPFYQLLYPLPFFSNIRNPIKFTHPMHLSLGILFAYGLHALWHQYVADRKASEESWKATVDAWRRQLEGFDKGWALGMVISCVVAVLAFLIYASSRQQLETHLKAILWQGAPVAEIAAFSAGEVGWSVFFLVCSVLILVGFFSGLLAGQRAKVGVVLIGLLLVVDLGRANKPWIVFINKAVKYADNDVLKVLRDPPYEGRVTLPQFPVNPEVQPYFNVLAQVYGVEWVQHHFQYYGIQSLDVVQMPRPPRSYTRLIKCFALV